MELIAISILILFITIACIRLWRYIDDRRLLRSVTSPKRGEWSERKTVLTLLRMGINPKAIFHDCYIRRRSGTYTQVDLVVATKCGLIAFEIKDYSGWIFGDVWQRYWTKVLAHGHEKYRFYNPLMQNKGHIMALRENLPHNPHIPIYSVVVFYGDCKLKNIKTDSDYEFMIYPNRIKRTVSRILSRQEANFGDKHEIMSVLRQSVKNGTDKDIVAAQVETAERAARRDSRRSLLRFLNPFNLFRCFRRW